MCSLPFPTIAAMNGHAYAAGFMFAMAHDLRVLREDLGDCCVSEINLGMSIPKPMNHIIQFKIPIHTHIRFALLGHKFSPKECLEGKVVDQLAKKEDLIKDSVVLARKVKHHGEKRVAFKAIKQVMYEDIIKSCLYDACDESYRTPNGFEKL